jgi:Domain of unknown function (DUF4440)
MGSIKCASVGTVLILCSIFVVGRAQTVSASQAKQSEQEVLKAESELSALMTKPDRQRFEKLLADDFLQNNQNGVLVDKAGYVNNFFDGTIKLESHTTSEVKVRIYGDAAIVNGVEAITGNRSGRRRFSRTYVKSGGVWRLVNNHITTI